MATTQGGIVRHVCAQGLRPVAAGPAAGLVLALAAARFIDALLFGVAPPRPRGARRRRPRRTRAR